MSEEMSAYTKEVSMERHDFATGESTGGSGNPVPDDDDDGGDTTTTTTTTTTETGDGDD